MSPQISHTEHAQVGIKDKPVCACLCTLAPKICVPDSKLWILQSLSTLLLSYTMIAQDHEDIAERRHLLRLWVSPHENRPIPEEYVDLWNTTKPGERGGIFVKGDLTVPLEAE